LDGAVKYESLTVEDHVNVVGRGQHVEVQVHPDLLYFGLGEGVDVMGGPNQSDLEGSNM